MFTKEEILQKLLDKKPISIVRCGDGEKIVLEFPTANNGTKEAHDRVFKRQMGYSPTLDDMYGVRLNLINAYHACDIIGVPNHKQKTNSDWENVVKVLDEQVPRHTKKYCDIDLAYHMLADGSFDKLLQNRKVLNYISCRDLDQGFKRKWNIETVNKYTIAPEKKFTSGYNGPNHYPDQFNKIQRWQDVVAKDFPGSLLLVGAGVIGKIYCNWWRDRGGIAFDCGAVFDSWAGKVTRGPERGLDKEDLTFKL